MGFKSQDIKEKNDRHPRTWRPLPGREGQCVFGYTLDSRATSDGSMTLLLSLSGDERWFKNLCVVLR